MTASYINAVEVVALLLARKSIDINTQDMVRNVMSCKLELFYFCIHAVCTQGFLSICCCSYFY